MTEAEWEAWADPRPLLDFFAHRSSDRKLRLFGVDCCRHLIRVLDDRGRMALQTAELYAEGLCSSEVLEAARLGALAAFDEFNDSTAYSPGGELGWESGADAVERLCRK